MRNVQNNIKKQNRQKKEKTEPIAHAHTHAQPLTLQTDTGSLVEAERESTSARNATRSSCGLRISLGSQRNVTTNNNANVSTSSTTVASNTQMVEGVAHFEDHGSHFQNGRKDNISNVQNLQNVTSQQHGETEFPVDDRANRSLFSSAIDKNNVMLQASQAAVAVAEVCPKCGFGEHDDDEMVACDGCDNWYHFNCVQFDKHRAEEQWYCPACSRKQSNGARKRKSGVKWQ